MDITQDFADAKFIITGYKPGCVLINDKPYQQSFLLSPNSLTCPWQVTHITDLAQSTLGEIFETRPEIVIIGTGDTLIFPEPEIIALFAQHQIGLETMNTAAACRTYGILIAEGRKATAGIIFPNATRTDS
jgi:uncharacterized protein